MTVRVEQTPNPNAMKFAVGQPVGGPGTYVKGSEPDEKFLVELLGLEGVASVFFTADFVTISKTPDVSWETITPEATAILEGRFGV
ncbi:MAG TPA: NifU N-terminal domain-containing protein [Acidimicrobiia bacterium]|nr:NifU N-terminal domain-containing protein [Acidimicrobiia bacterium]